MKKIDWQRVSFFVNLNIFVYFFSELNSSLFKCVHLFDRKKLNEHLHAEKNPFLIGWKQIDYEHVSLV